MKTVVTMTSYPKRINEVGRFIYVFMSTQTQKPDYFYLWLSKTEFKNLEKDLPEDLILTCKHFNVIIAWSDYNDGCTKRWNVYPKHYEDIVVAVDEDNVYDFHLIEKMKTVKDFSKIYAVWDNLTNYLVPQHDIEMRYMHYSKLKKPNHSLRMKIAGQSVYPPKTFPLEALDPKYTQLRIKYCPKCDESWLQPFLRKKGIESSTLGLDKKNPDDLMEKTGINANGKRINGVWWKNLQMYIVLRLFPDLMENWKRIFPEYDDSKWSKYSVDELIKMIK